MAVFATLTLSQSFATTTAAARLELDATILDDPPGHLQLDQSFDGSAGLIQPRLQLIGQPPGTTIVVPAITSSWTVGGIDPQAIREGVTSVGADLDACRRTWQQAVIASTGGRRAGDHAVGPLGYEITNGGPPPGAGVPVSFQVDFDDIPISLLTAGFVESASRVRNDEAHIMALSGVGPEFQFRDAEVDIDLEPDHGLTHGQIVILAMQLGGVPAEQIGVDPQLGSPRTLWQRERCVGLWSFIKDVLRPIGYTIMAGRSDNVFREVRLEVAGEPPVMVINELDIVGEDGLSIDSDGALSSCVLITGRRIEDSATGTGTGTVTEELVIETIVDGFVGRVPVAFQDSGGVINATGLLPPPPVDGVVTSRTTVRVTTEDGCETLTYTKVEEFFNPPKARYVADESPDGEPVTHPTGNVFFFDSIPDAGDSEEGVEWSRDRFVITAEVFEEPQYRADGVRDGTITRHNSWKNVARATKNRLDAAAPWDLEDFAPGFLSAGRAGLVFAAEQYFIGPDAPDALLPSGTNPALYPGIRVTFRHTSVVVETHAIDECDQIAQTDVATTKYGLRVGTTQLYADSNTFRTDTEVGVTSTETELSLTVGGKTKRVRTGINIEGRTTPTSVGDVPPGAGLPAAEICTDAEVNRDKEERFEVRVCIERLDSLGQPVIDLAKPKTFTSRYVETRSEAEAWGDLELALMHGFPVSFTMASPAPILDVGNVVELDFPEAGFANVLCKLIVTDTEISPVRDDGGQEPIRHSVTVRVPPTE